MKREMDQKSPNVTRGQAAEYFGLSKNALRNYETMCLVDPQVGEFGCIVTWATRSKAFSS